MSITSRKVKFSKPFQRNDVNTLPKQDARYFEVFIRNILLTLTYKLQICINKILKKLLHGRKKYFNYTLLNVNELMTSDSQNEMI